MTKKLSPESYAPQALKLYAWWLSATASEPFQGVVRHQLLRCTERLINKVHILNPDVDEEKEARDFIAWRLNQGCNPDIRWMHEHYYAAWTKRRDREEYYGRKPTKTYIASAAARRGLDGLAVSASTGSLEQRQRSQLLKKFGILEAATTL